MPNLPISDYIELKIPKVIPNENVLKEEYEKFKEEHIYEKLFKVIVKEDIVGCVSTSPTILLKIRFMIGFFRKEVLSSKTLYLVHYADATTLSKRTNCVNDYVQVLRSFLLKLD